MKKLLSISFIVLFSIGIAAQNKQETSITYDSTSNFLHKNIEGYTGQEFYLKGLAKNSQSVGYSGFILKYKNDDALLNDEKNIYKPNNNYNSRYEDLAGKYFNVLEVIKHPKVKDASGDFKNAYYLKLQELSSGDVMYYKYDTNAEYTFPFIVRGFLEKQKQIQSGKEYVLSDDVLKMSRNSVSGKTISFTTGEKWKCTDVTIDNNTNELYMVVQNSQGVKTVISYSTLSNEGIKKIYTANEASSLTKKFNVNNFRRILQNKVRTGMTKEMTRMAWGEPSEIKETGKGEEWIYLAGSLKFSGDKIVNTK